MIEESRKYFEEYKKNEKDLGDPVQGKDEDNFSEYIFRVTRYFRNDEVIQMTIIIQEENIVGIYTTRYVSYDFDTGTGFSPSPLLLVNNKHNKYSEDIEFNQEKNLIRFENEFYSANDFVDLIILNSQDFLKIYSGIVYKIKKFCLSVFLWLPHRDSYKIGDKTYTGMESVISHIIDPFPGHNKSNQEGELRESSSDPFLGYFKIGQRITAIAVLFVLFLQMIFINNKYFSNTIFSLSLVFFILFLAQKVESNLNNLVDDFLPKGKGTNEKSFLYKSFFDYLHAPQKYYRFRSYKSDHMNILLAIVLFILIGLILSFIPGF